MIGFPCPSNEQGSTDMSTAGNWCTGQQLERSRFWTGNGQDCPSCQGKLMKSGLRKNDAHILRQILLTPLKNQPVC